jgi:hypothetical protein
VKNDRPYKGLSFFSEDDQKLFEIIAGGEFTISGFQNNKIKNEDKKPVKDCYPAKSISYSSLKFSDLKTYDCRVKAIAPCSW